MEDTVERPQYPRASSEIAPRGIEHWWPIVLIAIGLTIMMLYLPLVLLWTSIFSFGYPVYEILSVSVSIAPLLYILGVVFMHLERVAGARERVSFSTVGGITLLLGAVFGIIYLLVGLNSTRISGGIMLDNMSYVLNALILPVPGIIGSLLGSYYALRRKAHTKALIAGGFSAFLMAAFFPLALVPIALGMMEHQRR